MIAEGTEEIVVGIALEELGEQIEVNNFEDFINMNEDVAVCGELSEADISVEVVDNYVSSEEEIEEEQEPVKPILTISQSHGM